MKKNNVIIIFGLCILLITPLLSAIRTNIQKDGTRAISYDVDSISINQESVIGYCQTIEDLEATGILYYILKGLEKSGQLSDFDFEYIPYETKSKELWDYACDHIKSDKLIFLKENYFDLTLNDIEKVKEVLENKEVDLMITFGTAAGQELFSDFHDVPTINLGSNNPLEAGFVKSLEYSGYDHLWAHVDDTRYYRQLKMFYDAVKFKELGVIRYTDSFRKSFTPEKDIQRLAEEKGFEVLIYDFYNVDEMFANGDIDQYYEEIKKANDFLANECDGFYMILGGWSPKDLPVLLESFYENKLPVFSQFGSVEVKNGALMSIGKSTFDGIGDYSTDIIIRALNGEKLGEMNQVYTEIQSLAYNVTVGEEIGFKPSIEMLMYCNEIFKEQVIK
jgi:ABC-type uncharacterized transport system substrate-binding protein